MYFFFYNCIYLFLAMLCLHCFASSLVVVSGHCSLALVHRLLIVWLLLFLSMGSRACGLKYLQYVGSAVAASGL